MTTREKALFIARKIKQKKKKPVDDMTMYIGEPKAIEIIKRIEQREEEMKIQNRLETKLSKLNFKL